VTGAETADGWGVRQVVEAGGSLFLIDSQYPYGTNLSAFEPATGEFRSFGSLTFGLLDMTWFDGALWVTSHTDHLLIRVDPSTGQVSRYPMPGKAAGLVVADGALWVSLYHPGALVRVDPAALREAGPIVADDWNRYPHRLLCSGPERAEGPTVILEPTDWIDYGSWSVVQAQLNEEGYLVCANGYVEGEASPQERAADLEEALTAYGIPGPYVLVASGDGVHTLRLFAEGRSDLAGVVLVDPMPVGFPTFLDATVGEGGHPPWADLSPQQSDAVDGLGEVPLTVIGQDPQAVFLSERARKGFGETNASAINADWQAGLAFYSGLSTEGTLVVAEGTGMHMVIWDRPDLVVNTVLDVLTRVE
jgi:pimeloyl-ACP methyl ester carboxylesterase